MVFLALGLILIAVGIIRFMRAARSFNRGF